MNGFGVSATLIGGHCQPRHNAM